MDMRFTKNTIISTELSKNSLKHTKKRLCRFLIAKNDFNNGVTSINDSKCVWDESQHLRDNTQLWRKGSSILPRPPREGEGGGGGGVGGTTETT